MTTAAVIAVVAFLAGLTNAVAGGGTFFTFPALTGIGKLTDQAANVTSTIGLWPGGAASVAAARAEFRRLPRGMTAAFFIISLIGGVMGAWLLLHTSKRAFSLLVPWLLAFATVIFGFSKPIAGATADEVITSSGNSPAAARPAQSGSSRGGTARPPAARSCGGRP